MNAARRKPFRVERQIANDVTGEALRIALVINAERPRVAEQIGVCTQDSHARSVERADPHVLCCRADKIADPLFHLAGSLVGKRDGQDALRMHAFAIDEMRDAMGEHAGLARAGTCHHKQRPAGMHDSVELIGVESGE